MTVHRKVTDSWKPVLHLFIVNAFFFLYLSNIILGGTLITWRICRQKKKRKTSKKRRSCPLRCYGTVMLLQNYLHYSVFVRVHSESREVKCHVCVLTIGPLQRRISVVRHFRTAITTGLPAVIYFAPNHDFWIFRICEYPPTTLSWP